MTKEEKNVVNPLAKYFLDHERSGAKWKIKDRSYGLSETGWDLQVERKNQVLLIEAKYIRGPFAAALAGLVTAPLTNRKEKMRSKKKKSWSSAVCWAIGCGHKRGKRDQKYEMGDMYQKLLDYFARNLEFWRIYSKILKVKYIFFVDNRKVSKISFSKIVSIAERYKFLTDKSLRERRLAAEKLLRNFDFR